MARGLGVPRGWLPAEKARNRPAPALFKMRFCQDRARRVGRAQDQDVHHACLPLIAACLPSPAFARNCHENSTTLTLPPAVTPMRQVGARINYSHVKFRARRGPDAFLRLRRATSTILMSAITEPLRARLHVAHDSPAMSRTASSAFASRPAVPWCVLVVTDERDRLDHRLEVGIGYRPRVPDGGRQLGSQPRQHRDVRRMESLRGRIVQRRRRQSR